MKAKKLTCDYSNLASFILRVALAVPFLFAAIDTTLQPEAWIGFMPLFLQNLFPKALLLGGFSLYEAALSVWLLSGWKTKEAALFASATMAAITLLAITITNITALEIVFRDIGLLLAAVALGVLHHEKNGKK